MNENSLGIVNAYLTAFNKGDFATARTLVTDDFQFEGAFVETTGGDAFFASGGGLATIVRGHRVLRQWVDGDEVCSIYEMKIETALGAGEVTCCEWHSVRGDKLARSRIIFDTAAWRALVPPHAS